MVMLVKEVDDYSKQLESDDWVAELKRDGNRIRLVYKDEKFIFYNRQGKVYTKDIPEIITNQLYKDIESDDYVKEFVLDGELTYTDSKGVDHRSQAQCEDAEPILWFWDITSLNNEDLTNLKWIERKVELKTVCDVYSWTGNNIESNIRYLPHYKDKIGLKNLAEKHGLEGVVLKKIDSKYEEGKTKNQLKVKFTKTDDYIVVGYTLASKTSINTKGNVIDNKRYPYFKALVLAQYNEKGELINTGMVGGGFKDTDLKIITPMLDKELTDDNTRHFIDNRSSNPEQYPSFNDKDYGLPKNTIRWLDVNDWFVIEIKMQNLTEYGNPFQPRFLKLRNDKKIEECVYNES